MDANLSSEPHCDAGTAIDARDVYCAKAESAASFAESFLMQNHRGVLGCGDHWICYGNDGYSTDPRSRREVEVVMERLADGEPTLGVSEAGFTWAVVVTDHGRDKYDFDHLTRMVWDAWMLVCGEDGGAA